MKISSARDKLLFTPGPLTTSRLVPADERALVGAIRETLEEMKVVL